MRRYARILIFILVLVVLSGLAVGFKTIEIGNFERGSEDTLLGLTLGLDLQGGSHLVYQANAVDAMTSEPLSPTSDQMGSLKKIIERRLNSSGLGEPIVQVLGEDRLLVQIPGVSDPERAKDLIGETAQLEFRHRTHNVPRLLEFEEGQVVGYRVVEVTPQLFAVPSPPTGVIAEPRDGEILLAWDNPGDSEITAYRYRVKFSEDTEWRKWNELEGSGPDTTGTRLSDLTNGFVYQVEVSAQNDRGWSEPSATVFVTVGPMPDDDTKGDDPGQEEDSATEGGPGQEEDSTTEDAAPREPGPPGLEIEFDETGLAKFSEAVDQMRASLIPSSSVQSVFPDRLALSLAGSEKQEIEILYERVVELEGGQVLPIGEAPNVREVMGTTRVVISLADAFADRDDPLADAREHFAGDDELVFKLIKGTVDEPIGLTGDHLARAYPGQDQNTGVPIVNIEFNGEGTKKFAEITTQIAGTSEQLAIFLDEQELIAPVAERAITGGNAYISGRDFTIERVRDIALLLEAGRLPIPIELILEKDVDAILGSDSLEKSVRAGVVGLILVFLFMLLYYRMPGLIAAVALLIYTLLLTAIFKMLPVTLTLSGIAAAILSIGMAVDANILIFERMKEEMRSGRTLLSSINIGFNRAWSAIRDSNVSTLITSGILYWFADTLGATVVQGFAATLAIGVLLSMFSAIFVSRTLLRIIALTGLGRLLRWFVPTEGRSLPQLQLQPRE